MTRLHFVKKARKNYRDHGIKRGDSYYWWKFARSIKQYSKDRPKQSQLTRSAFWSAFYSIEEEFSSTPTNMEDLESFVNQIKDRLENLRDETQEKFDNMPQGLQDGDTGQQLAARVDACDELINEIDGVDQSFDDPNDDGSAEVERADQVWQEVTDALSNISCD